jgi:Tfp pilus assembly protein PilZ
MVPTTKASGHVEFDDLLDVPPANDVERRRPTLRSVARWALTAHVTLDSDDTLYAGLSYDVTAGGVFVATVDMPPVGARVDLAVTLPNGRELEVAGVVRWVRDADIASDGLPAGCGIEWKGLPLDAYDDVAAFAQEREPILWLADAA